MVAQGQTDLECSYLGLDGLAIMPVIIAAGTLGVITQPFRGHNLKLAGDRSFAPWTVSILNDVEFSARNALEAWQEEIQQLDSGVGSTTTDYLLSRAFVEQLHKDDSVLARYEFFNMFPQNIGGIELNMGTADEVETFEVSFDYSHWERVI